MNKAARLAVLQRKTGVGLSFEDTTLFLLVACIFVHWALCAACAGVFALCVLCSPKRLRAALAPRYSGYVLCVFIALSAVSVILGNYLSALACMGILALLLLTFWVRAFMTSARFARLLDTALWSGFIAGCYALAQKFIVYRDNLSDYRPTGPTPNANFYGMLLSFLILCAVFRFLQVLQKRQSGALFYFICILFNGAMLYLSRSRAALLGVFFGILILLLWRRCFKSFAVLLGAAAAFVTLGFCFPALFSWSNSLIYIAGERLALWDIAVKGIFQSPWTALFGRGLFSFPGLWEHAPRDFWIAAGTAPLTEQFHCHNLVLECVLSFGFVGFSALAVYIGTQVRFFARRLKEAAFRETGVFFLCLCLMVLAQSMADAALAWVQTGLFFMLCYACAGIPREEKAR